MKEIKKEQATNLQDASQSLLDVDLRGDAAMDEVAIQNYLSFE